MSAPYWKQECSMKASFAWIFKSIVPKCGYGGGSLWLRAGAVWMESDRL